MRRGVLVFLAMVLGACSEPLELADWVIPVPEGARIVEYPAVSDVDRTATFVIEHDLVLAEAFGRPFYNPVKVAVADDGTMFVLDAGNYRVVAFDADGTPLHEFGREGQGPGEFTNPIDLAVVGDSVIVNDTRNARFSVFERNGTHVVDHTLETRIRTFTMRELEGDLLTLRWEFADVQPDDVGRGGSERIWMIARHRLSGEELSRPFQLQSPPSAYVATGIYEGSVPILAPGILGVMGPDGGVFVSDTEQYQVLALAADGSARWALRTTYRPVAVEAETKNGIARELREQWQQTVGVELQDSDIHFPEHYPAIINLLADARGNLFVVPFANRGHDEYLGNVQRPVPVDVYSRDGERLFAGMIGVETWDVAQEDHVYRIETDPETEERVVARYRLIYPFE